MSSLPVERVCFSVKEVAAALGVQRWTVYAAIEQGRIKTIRITKNGIRRVPADELDRLKKGIEL